MEMQKKDVHMNRSRLLEAARGMARKPVVWVAVLGITAFIVARTVTISNYAHAQVQATPFVHEVEVYNYEGSEAGESKLISRRVYARRSDGASMLSETVLGSVGLAQGLMSRRLEFPDGRRMVITDWIPAKTTMPTRSDQELARWKAGLYKAPENCLASGDVLIGSESVLNHATLVVKKQSLPLGGATGPVPNDTEMTEWRAPDLGCHVVQYRIEVPKPGGVKSITIGRATRLAIGEPDSQMFNEGVNYPEKSPSEMVRAGAAKAGIQLNDIQSTRKADEAYFAARPAP